MELINETPVLIALSITDLLTRNSKTFADITDVKYMYKNNATDLDAAALLSKDVKTPDGIVLNATDSTIDISIDIVDFGTDKLEIDATYLICIGVEFDDDGVYIEDYDPRLDNHVNILQDKIRT